MVKWPIIDIVGNDGENNAKCKLQNDKWPNKGKPAAYGTRAIARADFYQKNRLFGAYKYIAE